MDRSCLLCIGTKEKLLTDKVKNMVFLPPGVILKPGYCGEKCRSLLINRMIEHKYDISNYFVVCGIEFPGNGYPTHDIVFPQGRKERNEFPSMTAIREFIEETGIYLDFEKKIEFLGLVGRNNEMGVYVYHA